MLSEMVTGGSGYALHLWFDWVASSWLVGQIWEFCAYGHKEEMVLDHSVSHD